MGGDVHADVEGGGDGEGEGNGLVGWVAEFVLGEWRYWGVEVLDVLQCFDSCTWVFGVSDAFSV